MGGEKFDVNVMQARLRTITPDAYPDSHAAPFAHFITAVLLITSIMFSMMHRADVMPAVLMFAVTAMFFDNLTLRMRIKDLEYQTPAMCAEREYLKNRIDELTTKRD